MTAFKDAFRKAGRGDLVDMKEASDKKELEEDILFIDKLIYKLRKIRSDSMIGYDVARQHRNHFVKITKENSPEYFAGVVDPINQDIWRTGIKAKAVLDETNVHISRLEHKRNKLKEELK